MKRPTYLEPVAYAVVSVGVFGIAGVLSTGYVVLLIPLTLVTASTTRAIFRERRRRAAQSRRLP